MWRFTPFRTICALLISLSVTAWAEPPADLHFSNLTWGLSQAQVAANLTAQGFAHQPMANLNMPFKGSILRISVRGYAMFTPAGALVKTAIFFETGRLDCISTYKTLKDTLLGKYGPAENTFEFFSKPYFEGDGYPEQAISLDKGTFWVGWSAGASHMSLEILRSLQVMVAYEGPGWNPEADRRKAKSAEAL